MRIFLIACIALVGCQNSVSDPTATANNSAEVTSYTSLSDELSGNDPKACNNPAVSEHFLQKIFENAKPDNVRQSDFEAATESLNFKLSNVISTRLDSETHTVYCAARWSFGDWSKEFEYILTPALDQNGGAVIRTDVDNEIVMLGRLAIGSAIRAYATPEADFTLTPDKRGDEDVEADPPVVDLNTTDDMEVENSQ